MYQIFQSGVRRSVSMILQSLFMIAFAAALHAQDFPAPILQVTPGNDGAFTLTNVESMTSTETLGLPSHFLFGGNDSAITAPNGAELNQDAFSIAVWVKPDRGSLSQQKGLLVKSLQTHDRPWYQWGVFLIDRDHEATCIRLATLLGRGGTNRIQSTV